MNINQSQIELLNQYGLSLPNDDIDDLLLDLDDKITEIGFNKDYSLNAVGLKLQRLYDQLYMQNQ